MIALNRRMPKNCLDCPCLLTFGNIPDGESKETYAARFCAASHRELCIYKEIKDFPLPDSFYNFSKPKWCPWQEIYENVDDEESAWHMSMAGLGGSYD